MKHSQKSILHKVLQNIEENKLINSDETVIVAVSGGPDSVCLLDVLFQLKDKLNCNILACHYNHRLRGEESDKDEKFVRKICEDRGIECIVGSASAKNLYKNEESARIARYGFFEKILKERRGVKIAIAHNKNDFAETYLLRLFRGTGILGLLSIPSIRKNFIRPLLPVSRLEIENLLKQKNIEYRTDKTNKSLKFSRNFLRLKIIPLIMDHINPNIIETLANSGKTLEDDFSLLSELTEKEYQNILISEDQKRIILNRKKWQELHPSLKRSVIRMAISNRAGLLDTTNKQIFEVCKVIEKGEGKKHKVLPHSLRIELVSGKITISTSVAKSSSQT